MPDAHKNAAYSLVATAPSPATSGLSLVVTAGEGGRFPAVPFNATVWATGAQPTFAAGSTTGGNFEIVRVTAISTDTLTIKRAQESSTARTIIVGDQIAATITAKTLTDVEAGFSPDLAVTSRISPHTNVIPANSCAVVVDDFELGAGFGLTSTNTSLAENADQVFACPVTFPTGLTLTSIYLIADPAGFAVNANVKVALYNDTAGLPSTLVYAIAGQAILSTDTFARFATPATDIAGGDYWVAFLADTNNVTVAINNTLTQAKVDVGTTYAGGFRDPFVVGFSGVNTVAVMARAEYATEIGTSSILEIIT